MISQSRFRNRRGRKPARQLMQLNQGSVSQEFKLLRDTLQDLISTSRQTFLPARRDPLPLPTPRRPVVHTHRRTVNRGFINADAAGVTGSFAITLASMPGATDLTATYDSYRLAQVSFKFVPLTTGFGPSVTATALPELLTVIDYDDNAAPANPDELRQYDTVEVTPMIRPAQRTFTPRAALAAYSGAFTSYSQAPATMWFDCQSPNIEFYGLKYATTPVTTVSGAYTLWGVECVCTWQFKNTR